MGAKKPFSSSIARRPSFVFSRAQQQFNDNALGMHFIYFILFVDSLSYKFLFHFISILE